MTFIELIKSQTVGRVADVGCGPGRVAAFLAERGLDVVGVDVSQAMLAVARTAHPHIEFKAGQLNATHTSDRNGRISGCRVLVLDDLHASGSAGRGIRRTGEGLEDRGATYFLPFRRKVSRYTEPMRMAHTCRSPATGMACNKVAGCLVDTDFKVSTTVLRAPEMEGETTSQGFVLARSPIS